MADNEVEEVSATEPTAAEVFSEYFKKSQSVTGVLNPNIFWQLYNETVEEEDEDSDDEQI